MTCLCFANQQCIIPGRMAMACLGTEHDNHRDTWTDLGIVGNLLT